MRYEIYRYFSGNNLIEFLEEEDDGRRAFEKICAYMEEENGQLVVIDNLSWSNCACVPRQKSPLNESQTYALLMDCKMTRLLDQASKEMGDALLENYDAVHKELEIQAVTEVARLLGPETMDRLLRGFSYR